MRFCIHWALKKLNHSKLWQTKRQNSQSNICSNKWCNHKQRVQSIFTCLSFGELPGADWCIRKSLSRFPYPLKPLESTKRLHYESAVLRLSCCLSACLNLHTIMIKMFQRSTFPFQIKIIPGSHAQMGGIGKLRCCRKRSWWVPLGPNANPVPQYYEGDTVLEEVSDESLNSEPDSLLSIKIPWHSFKRIVGVFCSQSAWPDLNKDIGPLIHPINPIDQSGYTIPQSPACLTHTDPQFNTAKENRAHRDLRLTLCRISVLEL